MSSKLKRNFERRHITWKIKNFTKKNFDMYTARDAINSSDFSISMPDNDTKW